MDIATLIVQFYNNSKIFLNRKTVTQDNSSKTKNHGS